jgi:hypothetical protein
MNPRRTADLPNGVKVSSDRPNYRANPAHDPSRNEFNHNKTPEPMDSIDVYKNAVKDSKGNYYGVNNNGEIYQFAPDNTGTVHFAGIKTKGELQKKLKNEYNIIRKSLGLKAKGSK